MGHGDRGEGERERQREKNRHTGSERTRLISWTVNLE